MAPEQLAADPNADHRMDLYAVGLLAYELLTGVQPFSGSSPQATMAAQLTRMPTPLEECCPGVPPELARLITRLLAKHPDDRPLTAAAALAELEDLATPAGVTAGGVASPGESVTGPSSGATPVTVSPSRGPRRAVAIGVAVAALAVAGIALALTRNSSGTRGGAAAALSTAPAPVRTDSAAPATPLVRLTHDDSLRIADAVRAQMAKARLSGTPVPNGGRAMDSLRRTVTRAYTDSALRGATVAAAAPDVTADPRAKTAVVPPPKPPQLPRPVAGGRASRSAVVAPKAPVFARPRRVAILPVRDATLRAEVAPTTRVLEDSLRKTVVGMGYSPATDSELLRLLSQPDLNVQRRIADDLGIGAIVMTVLSTRGDEIVAQSIVLDVWRNYPFSDRTATDLDKPQEALGVVRNVSRALERVSWRTRADPKLVLVFDLENQTGSDSLTIVTRQLSDSLRGLVSKRFGAQVVTDSAARATREVMERRAMGARVGAGAIVAGSLYRARGDSVTLRLSTRDMSEDRTLPNIEIRMPKQELLAGFPTVAQRVLADLAQVNWGPKASR